MMGLREDIAAAVKQVRRQPGFALLVMFTLGSAMGISTALFSVSDATWGREWPVPEADRLAVAWAAVSVEEARYWGDHAKSFSGMAADVPRFSGQRVEGRRVYYDFVTSNYFGVLRIPIVLGRNFADLDDRLAGGEAEGVISYRTWQERFDADPGIIGRRILLGSSSFTVSGVAAPGFEGAGTLLRRHFWFSLSARSIFAPEPARPPGQDRPREVQVVGRLAPGITAEQASAELFTLSQRFWAERGKKGERVALKTSETVSESRPGRAQAQATYYTMLIAVAFLCMIACANVSNLLLAKGHARRGEIAVRLSLGASRTRLVRQLLFEAFLMSLGAGLLGVAVASALPAHLLSSVPDIWEMVRLDFHLDGRVFGWTLLLSVLSCVVFGLAPALEVTGLRASEILKDTHGQSSRTLRTSLTSMQAFVSMMALGIAGLVLRSDTFVQARALADRMSPLLLVRPTLPRYEPARIALVKQQFLDGLTGLLGARNVAVAREEPRPGVAGERADLEVSPGYFGILGLSFVDGRGFEDRDPKDTVAVVSETLAASLWPGERAVGKTLPATGSITTPREVIGVVKDATPGVPASYRSVAGDGMNVFLVRESEARFRARIATVTAAVDPGLQVEAMPGELWLTQAAPGAVLTTRVFGEFGMFTLALTAIGLFSLSEYLVRQRTREIGIRTALGARPRHILSAIFRPATTSLASGLAAGIPGAIAAGFMMRHWGLPTGVRPLDGWTYLLVGALMAGTALIALWRPSIKAMRVAPSEALRYE